MTSYEQIAVMLGVIGVIVAAAGVIVSAIATMIAVSAQRKQRALTEELHKDARLLTQRRAFIDIWPVIAEMKDIDSENASPATVVENINKLELVAACWEGEMVDITLIRRTFQARYIEMVERIRSVPQMKTLRGKSGQDLLSENPAVERLYNSLKEKSLNSGAVQSLDEERKKLSSLPIR
jgi:hypothetical protein